jgi:transcriptional regulator with XRE-family HTH domain
MPDKKITSRNEIFRRLKAGESQSDVARAMNVSPQRISQIVIKYKGIDDPDSFRLPGRIKKEKPPRVARVKKEKPPRVARVKKEKPPKVFVPIQASVIMEHARNGLDEFQIEAVTGYSKKRIVLVLIKNGFRKARQFTAKARILELAAQGKTQATIAFEAGIDLGYVMSVFRLNGLPDSRRTKWEYEQEYNKLVAAADKEKLNDDEV